MSTVRVWGVVLFVVFAAAGCHTRPPATAPSRNPAPSPTASTRPPAPPRAAASRPPAPLSDADLFRGKSRDKLNSEHPLRDAFFDYGQRTLRAAPRLVLHRAAQW